MNRSLYTQGAIAPGEFELVGIPRDDGVGKPLVVAIHSAGGSAGSYKNTATSPGIFRIFNMLSDTYAVIATDFGGVATWGSDVVLTRFDSILTWAAANLPGVDVSKVYIWAQSMGNWNALRCAADRRSRVRSIVANVPVCDINDIRNRNVIGARAPIDAAWGVAYPAALPARADLLARAQAGELSGLPWLGLISSGDTVCLPETVEQMKQAIGSTASYKVVSAQAHGDSPILDSNPLDILSFFAQT